MAKKGEKGLSAEKDEFSEWFTQIMLKADLADYSSVSGCIIFKPTSYAIWEKIKEETDKRFKKLGMKNVYFPLLIPEKSFKKEQEHVEGFSPEVAWVTQAGNTKLSERLAIRPTSESIMYESYAKWIRSWRDLPLKYNQWNNVVRWEFKHPVPFLRTREFLWNEAHNAYAKEKECVDEGKKILDVYKDICENYLALYGVAGKKTDNEKFPGAVFSEKIHYVMPNGKAIEGPCFHYDGQNFAEAYGIKFLNGKGKENYVHQSTFAITTRMLGVMFAIHSDDKGLILPPKIAPNKIVVVPIFTDKNRKEVLKSAKEVVKSLSKFDVLLDDREEHRPGYKFNEWELKGIPIRIELGERDMKKKEVVMARRDNNEKKSIKVKNLKSEVEKALEDIQKNLFEKSKKLFKSKVKRAKDLNDFVKKIKEKNVVIIPLCNDASVEDMLKHKSGGAKTLFITDEKVKKGTKCIVSGKDADYYVYAAKTY